MFFKFFEKSFPTSRNTRIFFDMSTFLTFTIFNVSMNSNQNGYLESITELVTLLVKEELSSILEVSARTGPRTGGYEFDQQVISSIANQAYVFRKQSEDGMNSSSATIKKNALKSKVVQYDVKDPISGKIKKIKFHFIYDKERESTGYYQPYDGPGGKIVINTSQADATTPWFKSIISHELSHYFDRELQDATNSDSEHSEYYSSRNEQMAFGHQIISEITVIAQGIAEDIKKGKEISVSFAKSLIKKPHVLLANLMSRDVRFKRLVTNITEKNPDWLKMVYKACFDIAQNILQPAVSEYEQRKKI